MCRDPTGNCSHPPTAINQEDYNGMQLPFLLHLFSTLVTLLHVFDCRYNKIGGIARKGAIISLNG
jgi:hypothetical protein